MTPIVEPFAGCRSLLLTRQTYHVIPRVDGEVSCCECGGARAWLSSWSGVPLSGLLVPESWNKLTTLVNDPTRDLLLGRSS